MDNASSIAEFHAGGDRAIAGGAPAPLWPALHRAMAAETARWPRIVPTDAVFAVMPLDAVRDIAARPDGADLLEAAHILADVEARRLGAFRFPKRRLEWLGGRLAAKAALLELLDSDAEPASLIIENDGHGRPLAANSGSSPAPLAISITHSGDFAAALAAPCPCGLDVQEIRPNLAKVRDYFADADEIALRGEDAENDCLARIWAAKEAIKKCRYPAEPTFMERIKITGRAGETLLCRLADTGETVRARTALHAGYALALHLDQPEPAAKNA